MTRSSVQSCSMAAQENGSKLQGCLLSPTLFNIFIERVICEAFDDHEGSVSIGGRLVTNFRFPDGIVVIAEEEAIAGVLVDCLDRNITRYKMGI